MGLSTESRSRSASRNPNPPASHRPGRRTPSCKPAGPARREPWVDVDRDAELDGGRVDVRVVGVVDHPQQERRVGAPRTLRNADNQRRPLHRRDRLDQDAARRSADGPLRRAGDHQRSPHGGVHTVPRLSVPRLQPDTGSRAARCGARPNRTCNREASRTMRPSHPISHPDYIPVR